MRTYRLHIWVEHIKVVYRGLSAPIFRFIFLQEEIESKSVVFYFPLNLPNHRSLKMLSETESLKNDESSSSDNQVIYYRLKLFRWGNFRTENQINHLNNNNNNKFIAQIS